MSDTKMTSAGTTNLIPYLTCRDAAGAYAFYQEALGAEPGGMYALPDGRVLNASLSIGGGATLYLCDEFPEHGGKSPLSLGGTPVMLHLRVPDCDAAFGRAIGAGCTPCMEPHDAFWGDRYAQFTDPYGHIWGLSTAQRQVGPEEMERAMAAAAPGAGTG